MAVMYKNETSGAQGGSPGRQSFTWSRIWEMVVASTKDMMRDNQPQWAAAVSYYALLSFLPLVLAGILIASFFFNQQVLVQRLTSSIGNYIPMGQARIQQVIQSALQSRGTVSVVSLLILLWSGTRVFAAVTKALNISYDVDDQYSFWKRLWIEFLMTVTLGALFVLALAARALLSIFVNAIGFLPTSGFLFQLFVIGIRGVLLLTAFFLLYMYVPRKNVNWKAALLGSIVATAFFLIARPAFSYWTSNFANYNLLYGSYAVVIALIIWAWIVALIMLYGGELTSHTQAMLIEGKSSQEVEQRHLERSPTRKGEAERARQQAQVSVQKRPLVREYPDHAIPARRGVAERGYTRQETTAGKRLGNFGLKALAIIASTLGLVLGWFFARVRK